MFPELRARPLGVRHVHRELRAAAGRVRRPELFHDGPGRHLRHPRRHQRRRARGPHVPLPLRVHDERHRARGRRQQRRDPAAQRGPDFGRQQRRAQRRRNLHGAGRARADRGRDRQLLHEHRRQRHAVRKTDRQHRLQVDPRLRELRRRARLFGQHAGLHDAGPPLRRPAPRRLRGQPRRDLRPRQHPGRTRDRQPLGRIERDPPTRTSPRSRSSFRSRA